MNGKNIGVLIADNDESIRTLLVRLIQEQADMIVVGQASNGSQAVAIAECLRPDVVVMDGAMPVIGGVEAAAILTRTMPDVRVVAFSSDAMLLTKMTTAGAAAAVEKTCALDDLLGAIRRVHAHSDFRNRRIHTSAETPSLKGTA